MKIGYLILTECNISFSDELGTDDFPGEMICNITLENTENRDKGLIEKMF